MTLFCPTRDLGNGGNPVGESSIVASARELQLPTDPYKLARASNSWESLPINLMTLSIISHSESWTLDSFKLYFWWIRSLSASAVMSIIYGLQIAEYDDRYVALAEDTNRRGSIAAIPGGMLINAFPICMSRLTALWDVGFAYTWVWTQ